MLLVSHALEAVESDLIQAMTSVKDLLAVFKTMTLVNDLLAVFKTMTSSE